VGGAASSENGFYVVYAPWAALPQEVVEALGCTPLARRRIQLASGREEVWPIAVVLAGLEGQELPTVCLIGPAGGPALLGAVTLEEFGLGVDPIARRLVPVTGYLMGAARA
jgi:predicted aspartyl protease